MISQHSTSLYFDWYFRLLISICIFFYLFNDCLPGHCLSENYMFGIERRSCRESDKKLRIIGVRSLICHTEKKRFIMLQFKVLILESCAIYWLSSCSVAILEITTLSHKSLYHSMEDTAFISESFLVGCKFSEILTGFGDNVVEEFKLNLPFFFSIYWNDEVYILFLFGGLRPHMFPF